MIFLLKVKIKNRGMVIVLALVFLFVVGLLALGIDYFSRGQRGMSYHAYDNEIVFQTGESALDAAMKYYLTKFHDIKSPLYKKFISKSVSKISLPEFYPENFKPLKKMVSDYPGLKLSVTGTLTNLETIITDQTDTLEKKGDISLRADISYRSVRKVILVSKRFKIANVIPPLISKFTLFNKEAATYDYNIEKNRKSGTIVSGSPLILINGTFGVDNSYGWIYLGGGRVNLNISSGDRNYGENFHLPPTLTKSIFFPDQEYGLLNANVGFYSKLSGEKVFRYFPNKSSFKSSCLRLFGCSAVNSGNATPTIVVGDVWRRYVQASAISKINGGILSKVVSLPWAYSNTQFPRKGVPPFLFMSKRFYQIYMSQVREEPYNRSFDFILSMGKTPTPLYCSSIFKKRFKKIYPCSDTNIELKRCDGETYYSGNLKYFKMKGAIYNKIGLVYDNIEDFMKIHLKKVDGENYIYINGLAYIKGKKSDLRKYSPLKVSGKGVLVFNGSVAVGNITLDDPDKDMFSIVQLGGNLYISGNKIHAALAAMEGHVIIKRNTDVKGIIAGKVFKPNELINGGIVEYDERYDPEGKRYFDFYSFSLKTKASRFWED